jgi:hypothetical protein
MQRNAIHPTDHAINRFEQRVLPHLPEMSRRRLQNKQQIKQSLYDLARRAEYSEDAKRMLHLQVFFIVHGYPPIPVTLVVNPVNRTLCTLYISPGWENVGDEMNPKWVWCS